MGPVRTFGRSAVGAAHMRDFWRSSTRYSSALRNACTEAPSAFTQGRYLRLCIPISLTPARGRLDSAQMMEVPPGGFEGKKPYG